jgi:hypothetical protein
MVEHDYQAWYAYPQYRWLFNKLELSLKLGYHAGPAGIPVEQTGFYIVKPVYNPYGMGIGASKRWLSDHEPFTSWLNTEEYKEMSNHKHIPPGYFWCEWFEGCHYSIDYKKEREASSKWSPVNATQGFHKNEVNLTKFDYWVNIEPPEIELPKWVHELETEELNVEFKDNKIIEIHLRSGNDIALVTNIGDKIYPAWEGDNLGDVTDLEFIPNLSNDQEDYTACGNISDVRLGYYIERKR